MRMTILCVDDEKSILDSLKGQLKRHFSDKYSLECAESAEEANEILEELIDEGTEVILVVSDWLMPGVKGDEFLLSVHSRWPHIKKVLLTGHATEEALSRLRESKVLKALLHKPWKEEDLVSVIREDAS